MQNHFFMCDRPRYIAIKERRKTAPNQETVALAHSNRVILFAFQLTANACAADSF